MNLVALLHHVVSHDLCGIDFFVFGLDDRYGGGFSIRLGTSRDVLRISSRPKSVSRRECVAILRLWLDADGGGLKQFAARRRLTDHLDPDWKDWTTALLTDLMEEDMYGNHFLDFYHFISSILLHWVKYPDHPFPVPPPSPVPMDMTYATVPTPPTVIPFLTLVSPHAPAPSSMPPPSYVPIPFYHPPFQGTWETALTESETFLHPRYDNHPWVLEYVPHAEYYYFSDSAPLPIYPPTSPSPLLPLAPPNTPRTSI